jgi:hypothetical protein
MERKKNGKKEEWKERRMERKKNGKKEEWSIETTFAPQSGH